MKFIKLTTSKTTARSDHVWIRSDKIESLERFREEGYEHTTITTDSHDIFEVEELPEYIIDMITKTQMNDEELMEIHDEDKNINIIKNQLKYSGAKLEFLYKNNPGNIPVTDSYSKLKAEDLKSKELPNE